MLDLLHSSYSLCSALKTFFDLSQYIVGVPYTITSFCITLPLPHALFGSLDLHVILANLSFLFWLLVVSWSAAVSRLSITTMHFVTAFTSAVQVEVLWHDIPPH